MQLFGVEAGALQAAQRREAGAATGSVRRDGGVNAVVQRAEGGGSDGLCEDAGGFLPSRYERVLSSR